MLVIYMDRFTVAFANICESSRECIIWYPWCLEMESSYGKVNPHTGHLTITHWLVPRLKNTSHVLLPQGR